MTIEQNQTPDEKPKRNRQQEENEIDAKPTKWVRLRLIPIPLRILLVLLLIVGTASLGVIVGYSVIGGGEAVDAFKWSTWQHILDIMNGKE
ncbi:DNA-directed RNA polymerase subunit beta [Lysinibacillus sp. 54212]|uniref:DNA-directed RNA polymerase subunit beta n=1 Tax=Lysinibacillus sp. 54212 TaxID=3119829 RepID=UPI002FCA38A4